MSALPRLEPKLYTADDLAALPSDARFELVEGALRPMPPPAGDLHGSATFDLASEVAFFLRDKELGRGYAAETGFVVARDPDTVLAPDFGFVARERLAPPQRDGFVPVVPDLVLETRSPGDRPCAVAEKVGRWLAVEVRLVWELDPKARVLTVHRPGTETRALGPDDTLTGDDVLPGFTLPLGRLFRDE